MTHGEAGTSGWPLSGPALAEAFQAGHPGGQPVEFAADGPEFADDLWVMRCVGLGRYRADEGSTVPCGKDACTDELLDRVVHSRGGDFVLLCQLAARGQLVACLEVPRDDG